MNDGPTDAHYEFAAQVCGFDPRDMQSAENADSEQATPQPATGNDAPPSSSDLTAAPPADSTPPVETTSEGPEPAPDQDAGNLPPPAATPEMPAPQQTSDPNQSTSDAGDSQTSPSATMNSDPSPTPSADDGMADATTLADPATLASPATGEPDPSNSQVDIANPQLDADNLVVADAAGQAPADLDAPPLDASDQDVFFSRNSATLTDSDQKALGRYADLYIKNANPIQITVHGFASMDGDGSFNKKLSQQRADAVKTYLSDVSGIKSELITATGDGPTSSFSSSAAAPNRRASFGPPISTAAAQDGGGPPPQDAGAPKPVVVKTQVDPTPNLTLTPKQLSDIFGLDLLAQWNAFKTSKGPVPSPRQLSITLTLKGSITSSDKGNLKVDWFGDPSIAVVFNSSDHPANDQEAINIVKLHWDNTILRRPVEVSVQAVSQNLFVTDNTAQGGLQPQAKIQVTKTIGVVIGGAFMLGNGPDDKFNLNASGFLGANVTAF